MDGKLQSNRFFHESEVNFDLRPVAKYMTEHREKLETLARALLERETLYAGEIYSLLGITPREEHLFH